MHNLGLQLLMQQFQQAGSSPASGSASVNMQTGSATRQQNELLKQQLAAMQAALAAASSTSSATSSNYMPTSTATKKQNELLKQQLAAMAALATASPVSATPVSNSMPAGTATKQQNELLKQQLAAMQAMLASGAASQVASSSASAAAATSFDAQQQGALLLQSLAKLQLHPNQPAAGAPGMASAGCKTKEENIKLLQQNAELMAQLKAKEQQACEAEKKAAKLAERQSIAVKRELALREVSLSVLLQTVQCRATPYGACM